MCLNNVFLVFVWWNRSVWSTFRFYGNMMKDNEEFTILFFRSEIRSNYQTVRIEMIPKMYYNFVSGIFFQLFLLWAHRNLICRLFPHEHISTKKKSLNTTDSIQTTYRYHFCMHCLSLISACLYVDWRISTRLLISLFPFVDETKTSRIYSRLIVTFNFVTSTLKG